ncbi:MAG: hypothetical protein GY713_02795 [Actinomycetia bacterium]|nr:hypothetical protein [Actinomycetes bacterium]
MQKEATRRLKSMTSAASMATRLPTAVILVSLISLIVAIVVGVRTGTDLGRELNEDRLVALRASVASDIAGQVNGLSRQSEALASSPQAVVALDSFADAYDQLRRTPPEDLAEETEALVTEYQSRYLEPLSAAGRKLDLRDLVTNNPAAVHLQYHYSVDLGVVTDPASIDDGRDGSTWTEIHALVHPIYRDVVDRLGLTDLYLIEPTDNIIVYSSEKRADLGTSLDVGPFSGSLLATVVDEVRRDPGAGARISDLSFYDPALLSPVGVVASPVMDESRLAGVVVLMYDVAQLTQILTAERDWDRAGYPPTGESFLFGADGLLRSDPRTYLEDPRAHLVSARSAGRLTDSQQSFIESAGTAVLTQRAADETVDAGIDGDQTVRRRPTLTGSPSFSTAAPVGVPGVDWYVATEVDADAADGDLDSFVDVLVVGTAVFVVALAFLAVAWASRIVRPVRAIGERLQAGGTDLDPIDIPPRSPIEFQRLADSFESMSRALHDQQAQLTTARTARLDLLGRMLPPAIVDRVAKGDLESFEDIPQATIVVVVVLGLGTLVRDGEDLNSRKLVDELHGELDDLGERHGLERVKVIGDAYVAACGHGRPYIDHAPRSVAFAADARDAIQELGQHTRGGLDVSVGLDTGPVTVGVTAATRLLYDVWGTPATAAHHLARRAERGQIVVSATTKDLLPDTIETSRREADDTWLISAPSVRGSP